jgi:hypothetical protein
LNNFANSEVRLRILPVSINGDTELVIHHKITDEMKLHEIAQLTGITDEERRLVIKRTSSDSPPQSPPL